MKYVIYTVINERVFFMCYTKEKGAFVASEAPDSEIIQLGKEDAERIAIRNSINGVVYQVKAV